MAIKGKSKWYNDLGRNKPNNNINPKMLMTKEELGLDRVPEYYKGKNGYEARKVCDNFDLSYHVGTAVTYLLRSKRKHESPIECLQKAINHIQFEIEKYENNKG